MKKPIYFIFAYVMLGLQVGISTNISFHRAAPNLGLIAALFIALNARRDSALIGAFMVGLLQDLLSSQQPGLYAFSYGLVAVVVVTIHRSINGNHPATHVVLALVGGFITACVLLIHSVIHPAAPGSGEGAMHLHTMRISPGVEIIRIFYTAVVAPFFLVFVNRIRDAFSFQSGRKHKGWW